MIKKRIFLQISAISFFMTLFPGCKKQVHDVDISGIEINIKVKPFEQALFACRSVDEVYTLSKSYSDFYPIYIHYIMPQGSIIPGMTDMDKAVELYKFIAHPDMDSLYKMTKARFGDFEKYRRDLEKAARYINYYFPEDKIETVYTFISAFNWGSSYLSEEKAFMVGLDMYMGRNFEVYPQLDRQWFPLYRIKKFEPYYIVANSIQSFLYNKTVKANEDAFIDMAIYEGKILYALDAILPETEDSVKIAYAKGQLEWNKANESNIWAYLIENDLLFSTDKNKYSSQFFNDGPFTTPFGHESPPRAGVWVGWQIVRSYMAKNPEVSLMQLLNNNDHRHIFNNSGYKP